MKYDLKTVTLGPNLNSDQLLSQVSHSLELT